MKAFLFGSEHSNQTLGPSLWLDILVAGAYSVIVDSFTLGTTLGKIPADGDAHSSKERARVMNLTGADKADRGSFMFC